MLSTPTDVVEAIERFNSWSSPWDFATRVRAALAPGTGDSQSFEQVWAAACDPAIWRFADDVASGAAAAESLLSANFPWLTLLARQHLARGAAYQWR